MMSSDWNSICSNVTDRMMEYVRPFVVPLSKETETGVRLIGTGTFVRRGKDVVLLTCEHVAQKEPLNFRPYGYEDVYSHEYEWTSFVEPVDAAWTDGSLSSLNPLPMIVEPHQLATEHAISCEEELLFFYGYSGENSAYGFGVHETNGIGYLTQQNRNAEHSQEVIEILWPDELLAWSEGTSTQARQEMQLSDPAGFSGSIVWNTRFLETGADLSQWTPDQALVTGILKRFVRKDQVLLGTPIEIVRTRGQFT